MHLGHLAQISPCLTNSVRASIAAVNGIDMLSYNPSRQNSRRSLYYLKLNDWAI